MAGGRPPKHGGVERYPELEELAAWFRRAMADAGYDTPNAVVNAEIAHKNVVYGVVNAARFVKLEHVRALAVGLGRDPAEVVPLWQRAKEAVDRAAAARQDAEAPRLTSWTQLPVPTLAVRNLVEAQSKAVERLPYAMLGVEEPPLSALYVRQQIRAAGTGAPDDSRSGGGETGQHLPEAERDGKPQNVPDSVLPVPDALARHEHLLLTGEPGAGKSTLSSHLAWTLARVWLREETALEAPLDEPVVPVRIAARSLVGRSGAWSGVLCEAVRLSLGNSLVTEPDRALFAGRPEGARWLVMVDGLDEIADRDARTDVIRTLAQHARTGSDYRFVVTTRPLPEAELAPLRGSLVGAYRIEEFGPGELRDFAGKWFAAQHADDGDDGERARAAADRFLKETEDSRLHELVRNPLLATLAAVNATVEPARPLPTSRLSLYQHFCDRLLTRGMSDARARADVRRRYQDDPERCALHLWLHAHQRELLGALGRCRVEGETSLRERALEWVTEQEGPLLVGGESEVREFLQGTGLLFGGEDDLRFLHHSFAEFIAAEAYAREIPPGFPDVEDWVRRAFKGDERTLAIFVFCLWSQRPECEADSIAARLLGGAGGGHERVLLAGTLMAEGVWLSDGNRAAVLTGLEAIGRNALDASDKDRAFEALGALGQQPDVLRRLERIAIAEHLGPMLRLRAVEAYSRAGEPETAERLLRDCLGWLYDPLPRAARVACALGESARSAVRERARAMLDEQDTDAYERSYAAETLEGLGLCGEAIGLARQVLADPWAARGPLRRATETWIKAAGQGDLSDIAELAVRRSERDHSGTLAIAEALKSNGEPEGAAHVAGGILRQAVFQSHQLTPAAGIWIDVRGDEGWDTLSQAVEESSGRRGWLWICGGLLCAAAGRVTRADIAAHARNLLIGGGRYGEPGTGDVLTAWLKAEGRSAVAPVMELTCGGTDLRQMDQAVTAEALLEAGAGAEAAELAELALRTPMGNQYFYAKAVKVLLKAHGDSAAGLLEAIWSDSPELACNQAWLEGVLNELPQHEEVSLDRTVCHFAREVLGLPAANSGLALLAWRRLVAIEGHDAVPELVRAAKECVKLCVLHMSDAARELAAMGERSAALEVWRYTIDLPFPRARVPLQVLLDLQAAGATEEAAGWLRELIADPGTYGPRRLWLRQMLAWLTTAESALVRGAGGGAEGVADGGTGRGTERDSAGGQELAGPARVPSAGVIHTRP